MGTRWLCCLRSCQTAQEYAAAHMFGNLSAFLPSGHPGRQWIALLPGSRWKEVRANLPTMLEGVAALGPGYDILIPVASMLSREAVAHFVFTALLPRLAWPAGSSISLVPDAADAMHHARASVVASGTATVLAAVVGNPFVVVVSRVGADVCGGAAAGCGIQRRWPQSRTRTGRCRWRWST